MTKTARKRLLADYRRVLRAGGDGSECCDGLADRCDSQEEFRMSLPRFSASWWLRRSGPRHRRIRNPPYLCGPSVELRALLPARHLALRLLETLRGPHLLSQCFVLPGQLVEQPFVIPCI